MSDFFGLETTTNVSDMFLNEQLGGGKELPPALKEFQIMRKIIAETLNIPNGPITMKLAKIIKEEFLSKNHGKTNLEIIKELRKFIESNKKHYDELVKNISSKPKGSSKKSSKPSSKKSSKKKKINPY